MQLLKMYLDFVVKLVELGFKLMLAFFSGLFKLIAFGFEIYQNRQKPRRRWKRR